jgi:hypothetical protein
MIIRTKVIQLMNYPGTPSFDRKNNNVNLKQKYKPDVLFISLKTVQFPTKINLIFDTCPCKLGLNQY